MRTCIKNGCVVLEDKVVYKDLWIEDEKIMGVTEAGAGGEADQTIDAKGLIILPGGIDVHTHFNIDVGVRSVDDFMTGTRAAAFGGNTMIVDHMGFGPTGCSLHHQWEVYKGYTEGQCITDYSLHGVLQHVNAEILEEMKQMTEEGISSFKAYLTYDHKLSDDAILQVLETLKAVGGIMPVHCENDAVIRYKREKFLAEGHTEARYHPLSRPGYCEEEAVDRMITLSETVDGGPLYIVHVSAGESVERIRAAKKKGDFVYGETCPQYLVLDDHYYEDDDEGLKYILSPPLRKKQDQEKIWEGLRDGTLSVVATDHCSFDFHGDKQKGKVDFTKCPNGAPGVETRIPILFSEGVSAGRLDLQTFVQVISTNPARLFGMYPQKGVIAPGSDADLVFIDPEMEVTITHDILHENVDHTPYEGFKVKGWPVQTMIRGQVVVKDGELQVQPGFGRFIRRKSVQRI
ncbi:MAG TPA: dihydropyrimidinase [Candidatus Onthocola gallistercoris]|uniref:Dihydropyrimidinase n=1 Tax=Candidatus Onthocola gallistercoris TaxID=2840876 RepID=A0A9D1KXC5_9FIRM|nr:dihydropyrimidinase [Candidatus Onthocola gallistercoris]